MPTLSDLDKSIWKRLVTQTGSCVSVWETVQFLQGLPFKNISLCDHEHFKPLTENPEGMSRSQSQIQMTIHSDTPTSVKNGGRAFLCSRFRALTLSTFLVISNWAFLFRHTENINSLTKCCLKLPVTIHEVCVHEELYLIGRKKPGGNQTQK